MNRGLNQQEAMAYVCAKRRAWEVLWAPRLIGIRQGVCLVFDREDLDRLFEEFKNSAAAAVIRHTDAKGTFAFTEPYGGRDQTKKENQRWGKKRVEFTLMKKLQNGKSTNGGVERGFASVASSILKKPKSG